MRSSDAYCLRSTSAAAAVLYSSANVPLKEAEEGAEVHFRGGNFLRGRCDCDGCLLTLRRLGINANDASCQDLCELRQWRTAPVVRLPRCLSAITFCFYSVHISLFLHSGSRTLRSGKIRFWLSSQISWCFVVCFQALMRTGSFLPSNNSFLQTPTLTLRSSLHSAEVKQKTRFTGTKDPRTRIGCSFCYFPAHLGN